MKRNKIAALAASVLLAGGTSLTAAAPASASIPYGQRCGIFKYSSYYKMVFVKNCLKTRGAVVKVDRVAWRDPTYCVPAGKTKMLGYLGKVGPSSVRHVHYLGSVRHC